MTDQNPSVHKNLIHMIDSMYVHRPSGVVTSVSNFDRIGSIRVGRGKILIDGQEFEGNNVVFDKDGITIDGKSITTEDDKKYKVTSIIVQGNVAGGIKSSSADVTVNGNVEGRISTMSGDVHVEKIVKGDVSTMDGDVSAHTINGKTSTVTGDIDRKFRSKK